MELKKTKTILLVDDSETNQLLIESIFIEEDIKVLLASDGLKALKILKKNHVDLILLDIMMPNMGGFKMIDELKKDEKFEEIPIFMISAKTDDVHVKKAKDSGAKDYIKKPIDISDITHRVKKILQLK